MKVKAKVSFCGVVSMGAGEVGEVADKALFADLIGAGYVEEIKDKEEAKEPTKKKAVKGDGNK